MKKFLDPTKKLGVRLMLEPAFREEREVYFCGQDRIVSEEL